MLSVQKEDSKVLQEAPSFFESSIDEVVSPPYIKMADSNERQGSFANAVRRFRIALLDSRVGWVFQRIIGSRESLLTDAEIVMRMSGDYPSTTTTIPDKFMMEFAELTRVPMAHMLRMLGYNDIFRLQMVGGPFAELLQGLDINHAQFAATLKVTHVRTLLIAQEGTLRAASFHIPELKCLKLDIRIGHPLDETEEDELVEVFEQISSHPTIVRLTLIARREGDCAVLRNRLVEITNRSVNLVQADTVISVIPP
ncbi:hypothetical protein CAEBREN_05512 [Caenorhabditis brenneri]|uniref:Uncharacterized protein n=1 Tax=Caenorhabditis brenneri TaxID=135651 RepID=G0PCR7_CAEBE|nr:hypothetical protein CAEBREN_05512 [Caenorhabditis brenneri]